MAVQVVWNETAYDHYFRAETGEVGVFMETLGTKVAEVARSLAPSSHDGDHGRPAGYMRDKISSVITRDADGLRVDVISPATAPDGYSYPLGVEVGTRAHEITAHGDYPLRTSTGAVLGRTVHHPGTEAHPYLRPALEQLSGLL
jgi:hypothetical protein